MKQYHELIAILNDSVWEMNLGLSSRACTFHNISTDNRQRQTCVIELFHHTCMSNITAFTSA